MKSILILGDGMAGYPLDELEGRTPLMAARTPHMDRICRNGRSGYFISVPRGMPPGSEVANLAILGYDVKNEYQGRGVLEAASLGVKLEPGELALRCNLICIEDNLIKNHSAGHISTDESVKIIKYLNENINEPDIKFYPGVSYRHLCVIHRNGSDQIKCTPPHDVPGTDFSKVMVEPLNKNGKETSELLNRVILKSQKLLQDHPVNVDRDSRGADRANSVWFWSQGYKPNMKTLQEKYGVKGAVISAVDLIQGIGVYAGMTVIRVKGATGLADTNYEGKAIAAVEALTEHDFVYVHVEASDEAGHEGNIDLKIKTIEYLDSRLISYILDRTVKMNKEVIIAVLPDHFTPCKIRTHTSDSIPFTIFNPVLSPDKVQNYDENSVKEGFYNTLKNDQLIKLILGR
jgi:2,3-bisphosphoglycerate-independent phosphoglycerate mutase